MKALSLWQPWATLIALKAKQIETRSWSTSYRGTLAIHASKNMPAEAKALCDVEPFKRALDAFFRAGEDLPLGAIVATCDLVTVHRVPFAARHFPSVPGYTVALPPFEPERSFGDYDPGRYAWILGNIRQLEFPIPCRGAQGLWEVPAHLCEQIKAAL